MPSVIIERRVPTSARSQASCSVTKLRLAASRKPSVSKPAGMPQDCAPLRAEPITLPPLAARRTRHRRAAAVGRVLGLCRTGVEGRGIALPGTGRSIVADVVRAVLGGRSRIGRTACALERRSRRCAACRWHASGPCEDAPHHHGCQHQKPRSAGGVAEGRAQAQRMGEPSQARARGPGRRASRPTAA